MHFERRNAESVRMQKLSLNLQKSVDFFLFLC